MRWAIDWWLHIVWCVCSMVRSVLFVYMQLMFMFWWYIRMDEWTHDVCKSGWWDRNIVIRHRLVLMRRRRNHCQCWSNLKLHHHHLLHCFYHFCLSSIIFISVIISPILQICYLVIKDISAWSLDIVLKFIVVWCSVRKCDSKDLWDRCFFIYFYYEK